MGIIIVITQTNSMFYDETTAAAMAVAAAADVYLTVTTESTRVQQGRTDTESSKCHLNFEVTSITTWEQSTEHRCSGAPSPTESLNAQ